MRKIILSIFIILNSIFLFSQKYDAHTDSVTYSQYLTGDWDNLIKTGNAAIKNNTDFKWLRQRLGYAWYMKGDYYKSINEYEKSRKFDSKDEITNFYLYLNGLNTGNMSFARYYASKLPEATAKYYKLKSFVPVASVDAEYNRGFSNYILRADPSYYRVGFQTLPGYRLSLYQMLSKFNQDTEYGTVKLSQNEYYGILTWTLSPQTYISGAYHYINTGVKSETDTAKYPGNMFFGKIQQNIQRFDVSLSASYFSNAYSSILQTGAEIGISLPGKCFPYLKTGLYLLTENDSSRLVLQQTAGMYLTKRFWLEAMATLGYQNNFTDASGMYFYNSIDPVTFRTGLTLYAYLTKNWILFSNYIYSGKIVTETSYQYNQHSISGGLIWKI